MEEIDEAEGSSWCEDGAAHRYHCGFGVGDVMGTPGGSSCED